ncbi:hypothetical protein ACIAD0981 [Acinetobacter baylyi ADP1]|uniref:Uncharacterized protein n=1 Tax=Acinetobacter baylyi (strain ATCC 33305 / BD413 / ADP1) TaxID=62977 RepID=Q6FDI5_ACIAD|nr:hypothetical protein A7A68_19695 [Acinetobacter baumannii]CAG67873.1 hypothetical protein ACIAD0981 [Acinetobacter baylyi ADP1]
MSLCIIYLPIWTGDTHDITKLECWVIMHIHIHNCLKGIYLCQKQYDWIGFWSILLNLHTDIMDPKNQLVLGKFCAISVHKV